MSASASLTSEETPTQTTDGRQFADPIYLGRINPTIKAIAGDAYPDFTPEEWKIIRGSSDLYVVRALSLRHRTLGFD